MKYVVILLALLLAPVTHAVERQVAVVDAEFWASPRNGEVVLKYEPIAGAVRLLIADPEAYLILFHPESEFGELWGLELQAWLVSLGIVSDRLELRPGYDEDGVALIVVTSDSEPQGAVPDMDPSADKAASQADADATEKLKSVTEIPSQDEVELQ